MNLRAQLGSSFISSGRKGKGNLDYQEDGGEREKWMDSRNTGGEINRPGKELDMVPGGERAGLGVSGLGIRIDLDPF